MLLNMCGDPSEHEDPGHMIARWLGMYSIHNCTSPEASDVPACDDDKGRRESPAPALPIPLAACHAAQHRHGQLKTTARQGT